MSAAMPEAARSWYKKKRYNVPLSILVALTAIGALTQDTPDDPVGPTSGTQAVATVTTTVTKEPTPLDDVDDLGQATETEPAEAAPTDTRSMESKPVVKPEPAGMFVVSRVIDGDTVELNTGDDVRMVGIDTPERGECGYAEATTNLVRLVAGKQVSLGVSDEDHDRYGRLLRYVDIETMDAGLRQIENGLAVARYDSRDGYGEHPRQARYIAADDSSPSKSSCESKPTPEPKPAAEPKPAREPEPQGGDCAPGYDPCLPTVSDLDCSDVDGPVHVTGSDAYGLDREGDGVGCES